MIARLLNASIGRILGRGPHQAKGAYQTNNSTLIQASR